MDGRDQGRHRAGAQVMTTIVASDDGDEQVRAAAAALLISAVTALCALAATGVPHDRLGGWAQP
jgi:hypothetical protein